MITRRALTPEESKALAAALEQLPAELSSTYAYPLGDLISILQNPRRQTGHEVEEASGRAVTYYLRFSSPPKTWEMLCGVAGIYEVDAHTLEAREFHLSVIS